jgi:hypothetical protein
MRPMSPAGVPMEAGPGDGGVSEQHTVDDLLRQLAQSGFYLERLEYRIGAGSPVAFVLATIEDSDILPTMYCNRTLLAALESAVEE